MEEILSWISSTRGGTLWKRFYVCGIYSHLGRVAVSAPFLINTLFSSLLAACHKDAIPYYYYYYYFYFSLYNIFIIITVFFLCLPFFFIKVLLSFSFLCQMHGPFSTQKQFAFFRSVCFWQILSLIEHICQATSYCHRHLMMLRRNPIVTTTTIYRVL